MARGGGAKANPPSTERRQPTLHMPPTCKKKNMLKNKIQDNFAFFRIFHTSALNSVFWGQKKKCSFGNFFFVSSNFFPNFPEILHNIGVCQFVDLRVSAVSTMKVRECNESLVRGVSWPSLEGSHADGGPRGVSWQSIGRGVSCVYCEASVILNTHTHTHRAQAH